MDLIRETQEDIRKKLSGLSRPLFVLFSGGKDSSVILHLVLESLRDIEAQVTILAVDTTLEFPIMEERLNRIKEAVLCEFPVGFEMLKPLPTEGYWYHLIGKGYPAPHHRFRWCIKRLKIKPIKRFLAQKKEGLLILGSRANESRARRRSLDRRTLGDGFLRMEGYPGDFLGYAPIRDWHVKDVWGFLLENKPPWGEPSHDELFGLYLSLTDECDINERGGFTCGGNRFGCWVCTVVKKDVSLRRIAEHDERYMLLYEFKEWIRDLSADPDNRQVLGRRRPLKKEARRKIFDKLLRVQEKTGFNLIGEEERRLIADGCF